MSGQADVRLDFDPYDPEWIEDPYPFYRRLRDEEPAFWSEKFDMRVLTRYDDVQAASRDWQTYTSTQGLDLDATSDEFLGMDFIGDDPPRHDVIRNMVRQPFSSGAIKTLEPRIRTLAQQLLDQVEPGTPVNFQQQFAQALTTSIIGHILGIPSADFAQLTEWIVAFLARTPGELTISEHSIHAAQELRDYLTKVALERRMAPTGDLISTIAGMEVDGNRLTDEQIGALCFFLFNAGVDTTATLITNTLYWLQEHPDQRQLVVEDPTRIPAAVEECLRYDAPLQHLLRVTTNDIELHGEDAPSGTRVMLVFGAANRDERVFENAERFDILRQRKRHFAFGEGVHFCLGAHLARLETRIALELIMEQIPDYQIVSPLQRIIKENQRGFSVLTLIR